MNGGCRLVELAGDAAVEVGVVGGADLRLRLCPQRRAVADLGRLAGRLSGGLGRGRGFWRGPSDAQRRGCPAPARRRAPLEKWQTCPCRPTTTAKPSPSRRGATAPRPARPP